MLCESSVLLTRTEWQLLWRRQIFKHLIQLTGTWSLYRRCYKHASKSKISAWRMKDFSTCLTRNNRGETIFANRNCTGCGRFEYRLVCTEPGWSTFTVTPTKWQNAHNTLCLKKGTTCKLSVTLSNLNRFSNLLHCWRAYKIRYKTNTKLPTSP